MRDRAEVRRRKAICDRFQNDPDVPFFEDGKATPFAQRVEMLALAVYGVTVLGLSAAGAKTRVYRAAKKLRPGLEMD